MPTDENNLSRHLDHSRYGDQQLNPSEQNHYLGTFRERVYYSMTVAQFNDSQYLTAWQTALKQHPHAHLLLNGNLPTEALTPYLKLAKNNDYAVQIKTDTVYHTDAENIAVVLIATEAVTNPDQNIATLLPKQNADVNKPSQKSWWEKLFKGSD